MGEQAQPQAESQQAQEEIPESAPVQENYPQKSSIFRFFSNDYCIPDKQEFCRLLQEGDLEKALKVLGRISPSLEIEPLHKIEAMVTLVEGYRALAQKARLLIGQPSKEIKAYRELGKLADLSANLDVLHKYRDAFETPEAAQEAKQQLEKYEKRVAGYEDLGTVEDLQRLSELGRTISDIRL